MTSMTRFFLVFMEFSGDTRPVAQGAIADQLPFHGGMALVHHILDDGFTDLLNIIGIDVIHQIPANLGQGGRVGSDAVLAEPE